MEIFILFNRAFAEFLVVVSRKIECREFIDVDMDIGVVILNPRLWTRLSILYRQFFDTPTCMIICALHLYVLSIFNPSFLQHPPPGVLSRCHLWGAVSLSQTMSCFPSPFLRAKVFLLKPPHCFPLWFWRFFFGVKVGLLPFVEFSMVSLISCSPCWGLGEGRGGWV